MKNKEYAPEGTPRSEVKDAERACKEGRILQGRCVMCDSGHNLKVESGGKSYIIKRDEAALGIREGTVGDVAIITRVNKQVCFKITGFCDGEPILSRAKAQRECLDYIYNELKSGDVIDARITHLEQFGAFCDIGCGIVSMIPIDSISVSRIGHPSCRFNVGMDVKVIIKEIDKENGRITVSHKELLGSWQQNADKFLPGQTVSGIVRSVESYGIFIELTPNLAGLAELSHGIEAGDRVSVYIKNIIPEKMKVKLAIVESMKEPSPVLPPQYIYVGDHIDYWRYSPDGCQKVIETVF